MRRCARREASLPTYTEQDNNDIGYKEYDMNKKTVPQSVFDSPEACRIAREGHKQACEELAKVPRHLLDDGNPNHPRYDLHIFGEHHGSFLARQYKSATVASA